MHLFSTYEVAVVLSQGQSWHWSGSPDGLLLKKLSAHLSQFCPEVLAVQLCMEGGVCYVGGHMCTQEDTGVGNAPSIAKLTN